MSTTFRAVAHCDEVLSGDCLGFFEVTGTMLRQVDRLGAALEDHGWLRGYKADQTYDVCPICRPAVEKALREHEERVAEREQEHA